MGRKVVLFLIWVTFVVYTVWLAPLDQPDTLPLVKKLLTFQLEEVNAILTSIFWLMGVWPMIYACLMFADGRMQNFRVWPYFIGSNGIGVICLIPYLILRKSNQDFDSKKDYLLKILDSRLTGIFLFLSTICLLSYAIVAGNWADYIQQFQTRTFVHLISLDFCLMCLTFPLTSLFDDDMARRDLKDSRIFWAVALVPLFGPLSYICLRPSLPENSRVELPGVTKKASPISHLKPLA
ncbi:DUF2834 domain-containing protein [Funiculus sociatus GB2-A5]|uniref:DUF2834 domain-containing protein n=1 Tax=Funiculus sociatus GB2-A5 TaxID=2933946 RepID=A0ABV0JL76_9CYAN|nr:MULTISPECIES: DUF2834 domain-containing protein [unclassified Trichocoleus]MBD1905785.1 DUF2834 domain-containing protein [Trichocoleus sp. FACHB-832]MBD2065926.1 DUF2834 domain-containing protein [Trichocoleus sp. FACHB-6]